MRPFARHSCARLPSHGFPRYTSQELRTYHPIVVHSVVFELNVNMKILKHAQQDSLLFLTHRQPALQPASQHAQQD